MNWADEFRKFAGLAPARPSLVEAREDENTLGEPPAEVTGNAEDLAHEMKLSVAGAHLGYLSAARQGMVPSKNKEASPQPSKESKPKLAGAMLRVK